MKMDKQRWQQIETLYHAALERTPDERAAFLADACADDSGLLREVEELLRHDGAAGSFMQDNALAVAAQALEPNELSQTNPQLFPGQGIGAYKILALLGRGGMGVVYRARDERLRREVAIKVLPASLAHDADRLRRFEQEAHATSALNHPNILTIYDIGAHEGAPFIVAELLEGEELRAQLESGALPARRALEYALQITQGLAAAHEKGIVHRDLKPENLFITKDGRVKILDFGLAKLRPPQPGVVDTGAPTQKRLTDPGVVMGTVGYMSPEQVRGQETDHRSDIFAFGLILYEMLSGQRAFRGASAVEVMNAILKEEAAELGETNAKISPQIEKLVRRCLEKKPERRFQTASDLGFALEALSLSSSSGADRTGMAPGPDTSARSNRSGWRERFAWIVAGAMALASLAFGVAYFRHPPSEAGTLRLFVNPPEKATRFDYPVISPDGRTLAFIATVEGKTQLWVRQLNSTSDRPLAEVGNVGAPFWSADSRFIGFIEESKLKKVAVASGTPETLCDVPVRFGAGAWNREGVILFSGAGTPGIWRISDIGGAMTAVTTVDFSHGEASHHGPVFLPDGRHFLFHKATTDPARTGTYLASLDGGETKLLLPLDNPIVGVAANPAAGNEGYLVFTRQGALLAQPYDFSRDQLLGDAVRLAPRVRIVNRGFRFANNVQASLSANGVLVLIEGDENRRLTWFDRAGKKLETVGPPGNYLYPRLSRDDQQLAVVRSDLQSQNYDIHLFNLADDTDDKFTSDPGIDTFPLWSPDGGSIVWNSYREGKAHIYRKAVSGDRQDEVLYKSAYSKQNLDWSADGRFILYQETDPQTKVDLWVLPLDSGQPWAWLNTNAVEPVGGFSPDGKWIAYQSNDSGRWEIYLQAFKPGVPASGRRLKISTNGGTSPSWRAAGQELYYLSLDVKLMAVEVTLGEKVKIEAPKELFPLSESWAARNIGYTKTSDGKRFLFVTSEDGTNLTPFTVVQNWMTDLKK